MLEETIEEVEQEGLEGANDSKGDDIKEKHSYTVDIDDYGFFDPDRPQQHRQY